MLRDRDDAASEHQHADGPDQQRKVSIVSHANSKASHVPDLPLKAAAKIWPQD
jgi:hypothetical protein